ncbi:MAG: hypothetical protein A3F13_01775 [Gammaproteobacteria bacterium RIFCSPHIGHO2_12_FULL_40_19]|nr:MAG: hypothetical protein A3F13_01775 [Gammaproteobacteria bacterium RIFCSPHIGHO2_12_FULL_40_19]
MDYLSRREHSRLELKKKLLTKNFSESDINQVLQQLATENLQSDLRFSESYVRSRKLAGFGPKRIEIELHEHGVETKLIVASIDARSSEWHDQMRAVWQRKFDGSTKNQQQQFRFLFYRGYTSEAISKLLTQETKENLLPEGYE